MKPYTTKAVCTGPTKFTTLFLKENTLSITKTPSIHAVCSENHTNLAHILG